MAAFYHGPNRMCAYVSAPAGHKYSHRSEAIRVETNRTCLERGPFRSVGILAASVNLSPFNLASVLDAGGCQSGSAVSPSIKKARGLSAGERRQIEACSFTRVCRVEGIQG